MFGLLERFRGSASFWEYTTSQWEDLTNWFQVGGRYTISSYYHPGGTKYSIELYDYPRVSGLTSYSDAANLLNDWYLEEYKETYNGEDIYNYYDMSGPVSGEWTGRRRYKTMGSLFNTLQKAYEHIDGLSVEYTVKIQVTGQGTTTPQPGSYVYSEGESVSVEATPDQDYEFDHWDLNGTNYSENPLTFTVSQDLTLTAVFSYVEPPPTWGLSIDSMPTGVPFTVDGLNAVTPYSEVLEEGEYTVEFPSTHNEETFNKWSDGDTNPVKTVSLIDDTSLSCSYGVEPPPPPPPPPSRKVVGPFELWLFPALNSEQNFGFGVKEQAKKVLVDVGVLRYV